MAWGGGGGGGRGARGGIHLAPGEKGGGEQEK